MRLNRSLAVAALAVLSAACGGQDAAQAPQPKFDGVTGSASKGPLQGATVNFYLVDAAGNLAGSTLATVSTDGSGQFSVTGLPSGVPILVQTSGGSYVDESDPAEPALRRRISFGPTDRLEAVLPPGATTLAITPYSMALLQKARSQAAGANFAMVYAAVQEQAHSAFGFDPILTQPADPITGAGGSQAYAVLLGAAALTINQIAVTGTPEHLPGYADVIAFVNDFADGRLDSASLDAMIRRFRNDNIGVYGGTSAPAVDEVALSEPAPVANQAPTIDSSAPPTATEDTLYTYNATATDPEGATLTWSLSTGDTCGGAINSSSGAYTFTPAGPAPSPSCTVGIQVSDGGAQAVQNTALMVLGVNDAPVINSSAPPTATEDTLYTYNATVNDPDGPPVNWSLSANNTCGGAINPSSGVYTFTPAGPAPSPSCTVGIQADDGSGPVVQDTPLMVLAVNDLPLATDDTEATSEDAPVSILDTTLLSNDSDADGPGLSVTAVANAVNGSVSLAGGTVTFTPSPEFAGTASFEYTVSDGFATDTGLVTVTVTAVNDAPSFTVPGSAPAVNEDAGAQTVAAFATAISAGPGEGAQALTFNVVNNTNAALFSVGPAIASNGTLTYTPASNANGSATITVNLSDNGGTANGGVDVSAPQSFTITISPVNDAPSFTVPASAAAVNEDGGVQTVTAFATAIFAGPTDEGAQVLTFNVVGNDNPALFTASPAIAADGTLTYTPAANASGTANLSVDLSDNGGIANGGVDRSAPQSFTITVNAVNDAPAGADNTVATSEDVPYVFADVDFGFSDPSDTPADSFLAVKVFSLPSAGTLVLNDGVSDNPVSPGQFIAVLDVMLGRLKFIPDPGASGVAYASFGFQVQDDGGVANGGVDLDGTSRTMTIDVASINNAPVNALPASPVQNLALHRFNPLPGLAVSDTDAGANQIRVTLAINIGSFKVDETTGATVTITGNGTNAVAIEGAQDQINVVLGAGVQFPNSGLFAFNMLSEDLGNSGGPPLQDSDNFSVFVNRVELGDLAGDASGFEVAGQVAGDSAGRIVASGGDFNGDGFDDFVIGAPQSDQFAADSGSTYVVFGTPGGLPANLDPALLDGSNGFRLDGGVAGDLSGVAVAIAGDFNGDGYDDLVIGADNATANDASGPLNPPPNSGAIYVLLGQFGPMPAVRTLAFPEVLIAGAATGSRAGHSVAYAGDVNADGRTDLVIGAPGAASGNGGAYVVYGRPISTGFACDGVCVGVDLATLDGTDGFELVGFVGAGEAGRSVAAAGDVNGDGIGDVLVGAWLDSTAYLLFGSASFGASVSVDGFNGVSGVVLSGQIGGRAGASVAGADLNGDGYSDVIVGADRADPISGGSNLDEGAVYVMYGNASFSASPVDLTAMALSEGFVITGAAPGDNAGAQVAHAGDLDADGIDDLLVGSVLADPNGIVDAGSASVLFGDPAGFALGIVDLSMLDGGNGLYVNGIAAGDLAGSVGAGGDFNADGRYDLAIGAAGRNGGAGAAYVVYSNGFRLPQVPQILGTPGHDNGFNGPALVGSAIDESLIGANGFDDLDGAGGNDVLLGGSGNDRLVYDAADLRRVDGGSGFDRLELPSGVSLDLTDVNLNQGGRHSRYRRIEAIYLDVGASLNVGFRDVLGIGGKLRVDTAGNNVVTSPDAWVLGGGGAGCPGAEFDTGGLPSLCLPPPYVQYSRGGVSLLAPVAADRFGVPVAFDWKLASTDGAGFQLNNESRRPAVSGSGRYVVFESRADVPGLPAAGGTFQIYRKDLQTGQIVIVSALGAAAGDGPSTQAAVSHDGRYVAFRSAAQNLGTAAVAGQVQVLFWDAMTGAISLVSDGGGLPFASTGNAFVSDPVVLSSDGRYVMFLGDSTGTDLDTGDGTTHAWRRDMTQAVASGNPMPVSLGRCESAKPCLSVAMSSDGRWVAWNTVKDNADVGDVNGLSDVYLKDAVTGGLRWVTQGADGASAEPFISGDGRWLAFESAASGLIGAGNDTNAAPDIFVHDIASQATYRASTGTTGAQLGGTPAVDVLPDALGAPMLSGDGRLLVYTRIPGSDLSPVNGSQFAPVVKVLGTPDGQGNLAGATLAGHLTLDTGNPLIAGEAFFAALTFDGSTIAVENSASNIVPGDAGGFRDIFVAPNPAWIESGGDVFTDSDGDGLSNSDELNSFFTNPLDADTDDDGLSDGAEVGTGTTLALNPDTDSDGVGDGIEVAANSDPTVFDTVYRVDCAMGLAGKDGQSWTDDTPATGPLGSNAEVAAIVGAGGSPGAPVYVLYRKDTSCGPLSLGGAAARQYIELVGSVGPTTFRPEHPATTRFDGANVDRVVYLSNATNIGLRNLQLVNGNAAAASPGAGSGGGLLITTLDGGASATLTAMQISGNTAQVGGGVSASGGFPSLQLFLNESVVESNSASSTFNALGGGLEADNGATMVVQKTTIRNNTANGLSTGVGAGAGIYVDGASLTLQDSHVTGNAASQQGPAQVAGGGGGVFIGGNAVGSITRTVIANNKGSSGPGGGINAYRANNLTISDSMFLSNLSARPGAGLHVHPTGTNNVVNNLFVANATTDPDADGGGVELDIDVFTPMPLMNFNGNTVAYNQTRNLGGTATGGGLSVKQQSGPTAVTDLNNNIVWLNRNSSGAPSNFLWDGIVQLTGAGNNIDDGTPAATALNASGMPLDPVFTQGFYLNPGSASIDAGSGSLPGDPYTTDPGGLADSGLLDIGFHYRTAAAGNYQSVATEFTGSICVSGEVIFTPRFAGAPAGDPGHLVVVTLTGVSGVLDSVTSIDPLGGGSRIARDLGDGRYSVNVSGGGSGTGVFTVQVDDQGSRAFTVPFFNGC